MANSSSKNYDEMFCQNLQRLREKAELRQIDLAADVGVSASSYRNYEMGVFSPTVPTLRRLAKVLGVDFNELLGGYTSNREVHEKLEEIISDLALIAARQRKQEGKGNAES